MTVCLRPLPALFVTDLDGTLLTSEQRVNSADRATLENLGGDGVARVIATGRSLWSTMRVIDDTFPIDYLVFSSGVGIVDWSTRKLVRAHSLNAAALGSAVARLKWLGCDFMVQNPAPGTHEFRYHRSSREGTNPDFERRLQRYAPYARALCAGCPPRYDLSPGGSHIVVVHKSEGGVQMWRRLCAELVGLHVVRTTSPMDGASIWIELFAAGVSKASACAWLAGEGGVDVRRTAAVGNDYNDTDLLEWAANAYVVANGPAELRARFVNVASNDGTGVSEAVIHWQAGLKASGPGQHY